LISLIGKFILKILVTGANGFVGRKLCSALVSKNHQVRAVVRSYLNSVDDVELFVLPELMTSANLSSILNNIDVVIHLAARVHVMDDKAENSLDEFLEVNLHGTSWLANEAARNGVKRFVFVSTVKVNGESTYDSPFCENDTPNPQDEYALSKHRAELALHEISKATGLEVVIVRPPLVYGPDVKANFALLLKIINNKIPLPLGGIKNRRSLIYVGNLVDVIIKCAMHPNTAGKTYLVSDMEDISTPILIRKISEAMGKSCLIFPFPIRYLRLIAKIFRKESVIEKLIESLEVDTSAVSRDINWLPPYSMQEGIEETVNWFYFNKTN